MTGIKGARARYGGDPEAGPKVVADIIKRDLGKKLVETEQMSPRGMFFRVSRAEPLFEPSGATMQLFRLEVAPRQTNAGSDQRDDHGGPADSAEPLAGS